MLPTVNEQSMGVSRMLRGILAAGASAVLALPTLYLAQANGAGEDSTPATLSAPATESKPEQAARVEFLPKISKAEA